MNVGQVQEKYVGQNGHFHFIKCTYCSLLLILSLIVIVFGKKEGRGNFSKTFENVQCRFSISPTTFDILLAHTFDLFCIVFKIIYSLPNQKSLVKYLHGKISHLAENGSIILHYVSYFLHFARLANSKH